MYVCLDGCGVVSVDALRVSVYGVYPMLRGCAIMSGGKRPGVQLNYLT